MEILKQHIQEPALKHDFSGAAAVYGRGVGSGRDPYLRIEGEYCDFFGAAVALGEGGREG